MKLKLINQLRVDEKTKTQDTENITYFNVHFILV